MSNAPPPAASPQVPRDQAGAPAEPSSGSHEAIATTGYVKTKTAAVNITATEALANAVIAKGRSLAALVVTAVALCFSIFFALDARSQTKVDGGVGPVKSDVAELKQRVGVLETKLQDQALHSARTEQMVEDQSKQMRIPVPPPVPPPLLSPSDGGGCTSGICR